MAGRCISAGRTSPSGGRMPRPRSAGRTWGSTATSGRSCCAWPRCPPVLSSCPRASNSSVPWRPGSPSGSPRSPRATPGSTRPRICSASPSSSPPPRLPAGPRIPDPAMPLRSPPAVQGGILEGLFTKGPASDPELTRRLEPLGFDVHDIQPSYPPKVLLDCVHLAADHLWPELSREEGLRKLGGLTVQGFQQTVLGSITLAAIRLMGPERLIKQLPKRFFSGQNYGSGKVEQLSPRRWEVHYLEIP